MFNLLHWLLNKTNALLIAKNNLLFVVIIEETFSDDNVFVLCKTHCFVFFLLNTTVVVPTIVCMLG